MDGIRKHIEAIVKEEDDEADDQRKDAELYAGANLSSSSIARGQDRARLTILRVISTGYGFGKLERQDLLRFSLLAKLMRDMYRPSDGSRSK